MNKYDNALKYFVDTDSEILEQPRPHENYIVATDKHIAIRIDKSLCEGEYTAHEQQPTSWDRVFAEPTGNKFKLSVKQFAEMINMIPEFESVKVTGTDFAKCPECHGGGYVDWYFEDSDGKDYYKEFECPVCDGRGKFEKRKFHRHDRNIGINDIWFNVGSMLSVLKAIYTMECETATIERLSETSPMLISVEPGVEIIIMPNKMIEPVVFTDLKPINV